MESDVITLQDIFEFKIDSVAPDRTITAASSRPACARSSSRSSASAASSCPQACSASASTRSTSVGAQRREARPADRDRVRGSGRARAAGPRCRRPGAASPTLTRGAGLRVPGPRRTSSHAHGRRALRRARRRSPRTAGPSRASSVDSAGRSRAARSSSSTRRTAWRASRSRPRWPPRAHSWRSARTSCPSRSSSFNPEITVAHRLHDRRGELAAALAKAPPTRRGHAHLRRAHRGRAPGRGRGLRAHDSRPPLRRRTTSAPGDASTRPSRRSTTRTSASSRSASQSPAVRRRRRSQSIAQADRRHVRRERDAGALEPIFTTIGQRLSNEYVVSYRSLLPPRREGQRQRRRRRASRRRRRRTRRRPLDLAPQGTFERELDRRGRSRRRG